MKNFLFTIFIFFFLVEMCTGQSVADNRITYSCVNKTLPIVLKDLSIFSKVNIVFSDTKINNKRTIKFSAKDEMLGDVLNVILRPYNLDFEVIGNDIVIISRRSNTYNELYQLSGIVYDSITGERLPFASIYAIDKSWGLTSNENGFYSVDLRRGEKRICVSYLGYKTDTIKRYISQSQNANIYLRPNTTLNEIVILDQNSNEAAESYKILSKKSLSDDIYIGGESDILHHLSNQAGVSSNADGFGGIHVRGGSYDQNLILLDGVPMHHTGHAFGLLSVFNSNAIQNARFYKGNFPSRYGGRLSSILDIRTREGNNKKFSGEVSLSTMAVNATIEGPIIKDKASFIINARRTYADTWIKAISKFLNDPDKGFEGFTTFSFYDINAKLSFDISPKHSISFNYFKGADNLSSFQNFENLLPFGNLLQFSQNKENWDWGTDLISLSLKSQLGKNAFSRFVAFQTNWKYDEFKYERFGSKSDTLYLDIYNSSLKISEIKNLGLSYDVDWQLSNNNRFRFGIMAQKHKYNPAFQGLTNIDTLLAYPKQLTQEDLTQNLISTVSAPTELNIHVEDEMEFKGGFRITGGFRATQYSIDTTKKISVEPRILLSQKGDAVSFEIGVSKMRQFGQVLTESGIGFPSDLWVTSTNRIIPADASQINTSLFIHPIDHFVITLGGYYKKMSGLISLNEGQTIPLSNNGIWDNMIPRGKGEAYGFELSVEKTYGDTQFDFNYTLAKSNRLFNDLNNGKEFVYKTSRDHSFNLGVKRKLGNSTEFLSTFTYATGSRVSIPVGDIVEVVDDKGNGRLSIVYLKKNNFLLPNYLRFDVGFSFYTRYKWGTQKFFFGVYNALNRKNPLYLELGRNELNPSFYEVRQVSLIPVFPSVSYSLSF